MFLGTQYHRPPNPRREDWERDLEVIKGNGLEIIRTWLYWGSVNPSENVWVWDEYDELMALAQKKELKVLIQLMCVTQRTLGVPIWFQKKHPEAMSGQRAGTSGFGPCFHNPIACAYAQEYMNKVAQRYGNHPALYGYDLWNEIHVPQCFCTYTQEKFRSFVRKKYKKIGALNQSWQSGSYQDFSQVELPMNGYYTEMFDRYEFEQQSRMELMRWRYKAVRKADLKHPLVAHDGSNCSLMDPQKDSWLLAEQVDIWGTGSYDQTLLEAGLTFHATACQARGKPWWLSEHTGGRTWGNVGDKLRTTEFLRSFLVMAMSFGAEAAIYWQWRPEIFGGESPHFGLTGLDGELTPRTEMVKEFADTLKRYPDLFNTMSFPKAQAGLLWEPKTIMYEKRSKGDIEGPEGSERTPGKWLWWENFVGWHQALMESGHLFDILNAREIAENGVPVELKLLVAPMQIFDRSGLTEKIEAWVQAGGVLITGPWYGMYDEGTYANRKVPCAEWFGVKQRELYYMEKPEVELVSEGLRQLGSLSGTHFIETLEVVNAKVVGVIDDNVVMTMKDMGQGAVVYIGTFLGNRYDYKTAPQLGGFIEWITTQLELTVLVRAGSGCFVRATRSSKGDIIVFLTNPSTETKTPWLKFNSDVQGDLLDLLFDKLIGKIDGETPIPVTLGPEDSKLLCVKLKLAS